MNTLHMLLYTCIIISSLNATNTYEEHVTYELHNTQSTDEQIHEELSATEKIVIAGVTLPFAIAAFLSGMYINVQLLKILIENTHELKHVWDHDCHICSIICRQEKA